MGDVDDDDDDDDVDVRRGLPPRFVCFAEKSESDDEGEKPRGRSFDNVFFVLGVFDSDAEDDNPCGRLDRDIVFDDADRGVFFPLFVDDDANNSGYFSGLLRSDDWIFAPSC